VKIYVGNLNYSTSEDDIRTAFSEFGTVDSVDVIIDRHSGRSKGFGFVEMSDDAEAKAAIEGLNGKDLDGRSLNVNEARPRAERPQRSNYRY
jgi:cold-inducible RNA-binding protein